MVLGAIIYEMGRMIFRSPIGKRKLDFKISRKYCQMNENICKFATSSNVTIPYIILQVKKGCLTRAINERVEDMTVVISI